MPVPNRAPRQYWSRRCTVAATLLMAALAAESPVSAQTPGASSAPVQQQPAPAPPQPPREAPGLINEIGRLLKNPSSLLPTLGDSDSGPAERGDATFPPPQADQPPPPAPPPPAPPPAGRQPLPPSPPPKAASPAAAQPQPQPAQPMVPGLVTGRQACPETPGGGSDCKAATDALCRSKGYSSGKSLAVDATEKCSAKVLIPGRPREPGDCRTENFVSRAWCQ